MGPDCAALSAPRAAGGRGLRAQGQPTRSRALSPRTHCFPPWLPRPVFLTVLLCLHYAFAAEAAEGEELVVEVRRR